MKIAFFPWSHGVGFGYIGRELALAAQLRDAGHDCVFACDTAEGLVARCGFEVVGAAVQHNAAVPDMGHRQGEYISIDSLDTAFAISKYYHERVVAADLATDMETMRSARPDLVVVDMQPTAAIAARALGIPLLSVGDSDFFRPSASGWMAWLGDEHLVSPFPSCVPALNAAAAAVGVGPIEDVTEVLLGDVTFVASVPELEAGLGPLALGDRVVEYIGPLYWDPPWSRVEERLEGFGREGRRLYVTLGHGGKTTATQLDHLLTAAHRLDLDVFCSLGFRPQQSSFGDSDQLRTGGFTGITKPIAWSDFVVDHGGYSTVFASLQHAKPQAVMPFMSEQETNGRFFVGDFDAGLVVRSTEPDTESRAHFRHVWRHGGPELAGGPEIDEVEAWTASMTELVSDDRFRAGAERVSTAIRAVTDDLDLPGLVRDRF